VTTLAGCQFCAHVARYGPNAGKPSLEHRHDDVSGVLRAVTDNATSLDGERAPGYFDESRSMWLPMPPAPKAGGAL